MCLPDHLPKKRGFPKPSRSVIGKTHCSLLLLEKVRPFEGFLAATPLRAQTRSESPGLMKTLQYFGSDVYTHALHGGAPERKPWRPSQGGLFDICAVILGFTRRSFGAFGQVEYFAPLRCRYKVPSVPSTGSFLQGFLQQKDRVS